MAYGSCVACTLLFQQLAGCAIVESLQGSQALKLTLVETKAAKPRA